VARWANIDEIPAAGISTTFPGTRQAGEPAQRDDVTVAAVTLTELDGKLAAAGGGGSAEGPVPAVADPAHKRVP